MDKINTAKTWLNGKKTYLAALIGILYLAGGWADCWEVDEKFLTAIGMGGLVFIRMAIGATKQSTDTARTGTDAAPTNILRLPMLIALPMVLVLGSGCTSPRDVAGRSLVTVVQTVDAAMQGWGAWVKAGQASAADEAKVKALYVRYQVAELACEKAYESWCNTGDKSAWAAASTAMKAAQKDLLELIDLLQGAKKTVTNGQAGADGWIRDSPATAAARKSFINTKMGTSSVCAC